MCFRFARHATNATHIKCVLRWRFCCIVDGFGNILVLRVWDFHFHYFCCFFFLQSMGFVCGQWNDFIFPRILHLLTTLFGTEYSNFNVWPTYISFISTLHVRGSKNILYERSAVYIAVTRKLLLSTCHMRRTP